MLFKLFTSDEPYVPSLCLRDPFRITTFFEVLLVYPRVARVYVLSLVDPEVFSY